MSRRCLRSTALLGAGLLLLAGSVAAQPRAGADEHTPSRAMYFDWINSEWPGSHESKVLANLAFFDWLGREYGMRLDIYHLDAGNIDRSPNWVPEARSWDDALRLAYGSIDSRRFRSKYPRGLEPILARARKMGTRLGVWLGPDGWGESQADAEARREMLLRLCGDYGLQLLKFDRACSDLRPEKEPLFVDLLRSCRERTPDLIALNHRIQLSDEAQSQMTTWLWEGKETYIDVHISNETTAPHHRAGALARGLPPGSSRLTEDHGVCLSSCLDYWEDDLVLQAFNRSLILAPEIYGNPWLLRDDEFPRLARLYNLHRRYRNLLVQGRRLDESRLGPHAVARGDSATRLVTLRNLDWEPARRTLRLDESLGLEAAERVQVRQLHPTERLLGAFPWGADVPVEVGAFRASLLLLTTHAESLLGVSGCDYEVVRDVPGRPVVLRLLAPPGSDLEIALSAPGRRFARARLDERELPELVAGEPIMVSFPGRHRELPWHRQLGRLEPIAVPGDAAAAFEATCFAADSNALEVRSLERSGPTGVAEVQEARDAFFEDSGFRRKGLWDRYAFDGNPLTAFRVRSDYRHEDVAVRAGALRLDLGEILAADRVVLSGVSGNVDLGAAEASTDLVRWWPLEQRASARKRVVETADRAWRYLRLDTAPPVVSEIRAYSGGRELDRSRWRASNLFRRYRDRPASRAWMASLRLKELAASSYLAVAIPGAYGNEGAYAALRLDGRWVGAPDRAPSFEANNWEHVVRRVEGHYTYFFPLGPRFDGQDVEVLVLGFASEMEDVVPEVWLTAYPTPHAERILELVPE